MQFVYTTLYYFIARAYAVQVVGKLTGILSGLGTFGGTLGLFIAGVTVKAEEAAIDSGSSGFDRSDRPFPGFRLDVCVK